MSRAGETLYIATAAFVASNEGASFNVSNGGIGSFAVVAGPAYELTLDPEFGLLAPSDVVTVNEFNNNRVSVAVERVSETLIRIRFEVFGVLAPSSGFYVTITRRTQNN